MESTQMKPPVEVRYKEELEALKEDSGVLKNGRNCL